MIEVKQLKKSYGAFEAVKGVSFSVATGQACGFLGPNGAGKTTTMRVITGYMPATSGTVTVEGFDCLLYTSPSPRDKRQSRMPSSA